jgi:small subunit ribosomal protein S15
LKTVPKDSNSKRGLMIKVGRRKTFLNYLKRKDESLYTRLVEQLAIRN